MTVLEVAVDEDIPHEEAEAVRRGLAELVEHAHEPVSRARLALRREATERAKRGYVADASIVVSGRTIAAHAAGTTAAEAIAAVRERLSAQLRRLQDKTHDRRRRAVLVDPLPWDLAHRPEVGLKPPAERRIVHRRTYLDVPLDTVSAVRDLLDIDAEFLLFVHTWTNEDVVVYLRDDGRIGLLHPEGSRLAEEGDVVVPKASRYPGPIELSEARTEMDFLDHRFLYFTDAADERGKVIYLRHDGDYGLVEPP
jgi:ribosome-associated translation inhibitor RaiA